MSLPPMREDKTSIWSSLFSGIMILIGLVYALAALGLLSGFLAWFFGLESFWLRTLCMMLCFGLMMIIPFLPAVVLVGICYYCAEVLDWGWIFAILFCFPGVALSLLAGLGGVAGYVMDKFRGR